MVSLRSREVVRRKPLPGIKRMRSLWTRVTRSCGPHWGLLFSLFTGSFFACDIRTQAFPTPPLGKGKLSTCVFLIITHGCQQGPLRGGASKAESCCKDRQGAGKRSLWCRLTDRGPLGGHTARPSAGRLDQTLVFLIGHVTTILCKTRRWCHMQPHHA